MRKHLEEQESAYGATRLVNLLNAHGHERPVKEAYERYLAYVSPFYVLSLLSNVLEAGKAQHPVHVFRLPQPN